MFLVPKKEYTLRMKFVIVSIWLISLEMIYSSGYQLYSEKIIDNLLNSQLMINILFIIIAIRLLTKGSFARTIILVLSYLSILIIAFMFGQSYSDNNSFEIPFSISFDSNSAFAVFIALFTIFVLSTKEAMALYAVKNAQRDVVKTLIIVFGILLLLSYLFFQA